MPAKWQQWMPFHIDRFKGSSSVQAMHPSARCGYLYLLTAAWQSDDCSIPTDPMELSELSALGDELWSQFGPRILRKFIPGAEGRLTNGVLRKEWEEAKRVFEARQASAERTNTDRWGVGHRTVTDHGPNRSADTRTVTSTNTLTKTNTKPKSSRVKAASEIKHSSDPRHQACKEAIFDYYRAKNGVDPDWNGREGRSLGMLLGANPNLTADGIRKLLAQRLQSEVNHAERPGIWIESLSSYRLGPLDKFGKPLSQIKPTQSIQLPKRPVLQ